MSKHDVSNHVPGSIARAARALLDISQDEAASRIGISSGTLRRLESGIPLTPRNDKKMVAFLEKCGLTRIYRDGRITGLAEGDGDDIILESQTKEPSHEPGRQTE